MKPAVGRVVLTAALFVAWLSYLGYLVVCRPHTPDGLRGAFEGRRHYEVVPTPPSPGYPPRTPPLHNSNVGPPRIYPATPQMLAEYWEIAKPK